jgi:hypothetical protein
MSSKDLHVDVIKTLTSKASLHSASKKSKPNARQNQNGDASNKDVPTGLPRTLSSAEPAPTRSHHPSLQVANGDIVGFMTANFVSVPEYAKSPLILKPVLIPRVDPGVVVPSRACGRQS